MSRSSGQISFRPNDEEAAFSPPVLFMDLLRPPFGDPRLDFRFTFLPDMAKCPGPNQKWTPF